MKKITVMLTLDDKNGTMFNKRRQSRDIKVIEDMCRKTDSPIYVTEYTAKLFAGFENRIKISSDPISECPDGCAVFLEGEAVGPHLDIIDALIIYRWNRLYPSDKKLDIDIEAAGFRQTALYDFVGNSHEKISKGTYKRQ